MDSFLAKKTRIRISDFKEAKRRNEKWCMLTSYDVISAKIFDYAKIPCLLVGDSAAQVVLGQDSTLSITTEELISLARAVRLGCKRALVVADLPFGSYQESPELALRTAIRFMKESRVHAIKLEGGAEFAEHVKLLTQSGIPVMAHIGFTPQSEHMLGGYKVQGRNEDDIVRLIQGARKLQDAGAFACVLELMPAEVAKRITQSLDIPTIGVGAGPHCDAHAMVWTDMAGYQPPRGDYNGYLSGIASQSEDPKSSLQLTSVPKFVKRYSNMSEILYNSVISFQSDVSSGNYPAEEHCYK